MVIHRDEFGATIGVSGADRDRYSHVVLDRL